jgi:hypothetical protein
MKGRKSMFRKIGNLIGTATGGTLAILFIILIIILDLALSGLVFWGIGALIVWAFKIGFIWTYWHGLCTAMVVNVLSNIFGGKNNE